jgi:hypothetical protein
MTIEALIGTIVGVISIVTSLALGIRWLVKRYFDEIMHELKPNSGTSIKDQVTRLEQNVKDLTHQNVKGEEYHEKLDNKIDHLTSMFVDYITRQR